MHNCDDITTEILFLNCQILTHDKVNLITSEYLNNSKGNNIKILCLSETGTKCSSAGSFSFENFEYISGYSRLICKGGGTGIWCQQTVSAQKLDLDAFCIEKQIEVCGITWRQDAHSSVTIINCYRSPVNNNNFNVFCNRLYDLLNFIHKPSTKIILGGDFNLDPDRDKDKYKILKDILSSYGLATNVVNKPTRYGYILDHVYVNFEVKCNVELNCISDHNTIIVSVDCGVQLLQNTVNFKRNFGAENVEQFYYDLLHETWEDVYIENDIDASFSKFLNTFKYHFDKNFETKIYIENSNRKSWVDNKIKISSRHLKDLFLMKRRFPELETFYREAKKKHNNLVAGTKKCFYQGQIIRSKDTTKAIWNVVKALSGKNKHTSENITIKKDNVHTENPEDIANCFNEFFKRAPYDVISSIPQGQNAGLVRIERVSETLYLEPFVESELVTLLKTKLKPKKSQGYDNIPPFLIRKVIECIISPLVHIINVSFETGKFPEALKVNKIIPLHKKNDTHLVENYRPVALSSVFSKILEYSFLSRLQNFFNKFNIINKEQYGFRAGLSTADAILNFSNGVLNCMEAGESPVGVFCDLSRAFDCVNHGLLLDKLERYGVRGRSLQWISSFLKDRQQFVSLKVSGSVSRTGIVNSDVLEIDMGVPQGSVLGPLLFLVYVNDMGRGLGLDCTYTLYADDASLVMSKKNKLDLERLCNGTLINLMNWFSENSLYLNLNKTKYIRFHNHQNISDMNLDIKINDITIERTSHVRFLGVGIDENMSWRYHCEDLVCSLYRCCFLFRNLRTVLSVAQLVIVYYAQVNARLQYGICFWGLSSASAAVFIAQKRIIRCIKGLRSDHSCRGAFGELGILTVISLYIYEVAIYIFKEKHTFLRNEHVHFYNTRTKTQLRAPAVRLEVSRKSVHNIGIRIFNKLPPAIKELDKLSVFKTKLKAKLLQYSFYSMEEFFNSDIEF